MMLLKTNSRSKREQRKFPNYLNKIRDCPCIICGGQAECAHLRMSSSEYDKVNGRDDKWCTPLCAGHHRLYPDAQHNMGEWKFWALHKIDPLPIAKKLWEARDDLEKMQEIAINHNRNKSCG